MNINEKLNSIYNSKIAISGAIVDKGQSLDNIPLSGYAEKIKAIESGISVSATTATASDVLAEKIFYTSDGTKTSGAIQSLAAKTYTPTTIDQTISAGQYLAGNQTVKGDTNLKAENIVSGKTIFGIKGTYINYDKCYQISGTNTLVDGFYPITDNYIQPKPNLSYHNAVSTQLELWMNRFYDMSKDNWAVGNPNNMRYWWTTYVPINEFPNENTVWTWSYDGTTKLIGILVTPISLKMNTLSATATSTQILNGYTGYYRGAQVVGTIQSLPISTYIPTTTNIEIPSGYYLSGVQTISGDTNLKAENIAKDVSIFGVTGTLTSGTNISDTTAVASSVLAGKVFYDANSTKTTGNIPSIPVATYIIDDIVNNNGYQKIQSGNYLAGDQIIKPEVKYVIISGNSEEYTYQGNYILQSYSHNNKPVYYTMINDMAYYLQYETSWIEQHDYGQPYYSISSFTNKWVLWNTATLMEFRQKPLFNATENADSVLELDPNKWTYAVDGQITNISSKPVFFVVDTKDATATSKEIVKGKTAYVSGLMVSGSMESLATSTFIPGTINQIISAGYYLAGDQIISGDANLIADNIKKGKTIFGVAGTFDSPIQLYKCSKMDYEIIVSGAGTTNCNGLYHLTDSSLTGDNRIWTNDNGYYISKASSPHWVITNSSTRISDPYDEHCFYYMVPEQPDITYEPWANPYWFKGDNAGEEPVPSVRGYWSGNKLLTVKESTITYDSSATSGLIFTTNTPVQINSIYTSNGTAFP